MYPTGMIRESTQSGKMEIRSVWLNPFSEKDRAATAKAVVNTNPRIAL
jgi:hypothetical protein